MFGGYTAISINGHNNFSCVVLNQTTVSFYTYLCDDLCAIVRPDIVDAWMRDSSERLVGRVYTHFPDKFMANQMDLVQFEF